MCVCVSLWKLFRLCIYSFEGTKPAAFSPHSTQPLKSKGHRCLSVWDETSLEPHRLFSVFLKERLLLILFLTLPSFLWRSGLDAWKHPLSSGLENHRGPMPNIARPSHGAGGVNSCYLIPLFRVGGVYPFPSTLPLGAVMLISSPHLWSFSFFAFSRSPFYVFLVITLRKYGD